MISYSLRCWTVGAIFVYRKALFACSKWSYTSFNWSLNRKNGYFYSCSVSRRPSVGTMAHNGICRSLAGPMDSNWTSAIINGLNGQKHVHRNRVGVCRCVAWQSATRHLMSNQWNNSNQMLERNHLNAPLSPKDIAVVLKFDARCFCSQAHPRPPSIGW